MSSHPNPSPTPKRSFRERVQRLWHVAASGKHWGGWAWGWVWLMAGCTTVPLPPADLAAPGWEIQETVALWRPSRDAPELAGELLVARRTDGSQFIQFSKQGLPLVTAQRDSSGWQLRSPLRPGVYGGRGRPTAQVPWFLLQPGFQLPPAPVPGGWLGSIQTNGFWRLEHPGRGERLEGPR
jgi:hypothetical protein